MSSPTLPYHFAPNPPPSTSQRRISLNLAGFYGQVSSVAATFVVFAIGYVLSKRKTGDYKNWDRYPLVVWIERRGTGWRIGVPRGEALLIGIWTLWVGGLVLWRTGDDYLHITRSTSHVAASLLPFHLLLSSPPLRALHKSYLPLGTNLIALHRLHSVLLLLLLAAHALLYLNFYLQNKLLSKRIQDSDVQLGMALVLVFVGIAVTGYARSQMRRKFGPKGANWVHGVLAVVALALLWAHVRHARNYVLQAGVVWIVGAVWRLWKEGESKTHRQENVSGKRRE